MDSPQPVVRSYLENDCKPNPTVDEEIMKRLLLVSILSMNSLAFAHCAGPVPCEMKYVDVAFLKTKRTGADIEKAKAMREEGEKLFKEGKEDEALKLLQEAKKFLLD
jgi:hypothetical protein